MGQDLGSSNKLFRGSKAPAKTTAKPPAKSKSASSKPKTSDKKAKTANKKVTSKKPSATAKTPSKPVVKRPDPKPETTGTTKNRFTEFKDVRPSKVEITVSKAQPNVVDASPVDEARYEELIEKGNDARDERNYNAAEAAYKSARTIKPRDSRAVYGLGNLYSDQQRWEEAERSYRAALAIEPDNAIAHVALSYVLTQPIAAPNLSERYEEAETIARRAIQLAPNNSLAFDQLGVALELRGLIGPETENTYRRAIQLDPGFAPPYAHLGRLLRRRGMARESAEMYENAVRRSNDTATLVLVAEVMQSEQRFAESEGLLRRSLDADRRNPAALLLLGRALTAQGKFAEAERTLRTAVGVSPDSFMANSLLGSLYTRQGNFDMAETVLREAMRYASSLEKRGLAQQFEAVGDGFMKAANRRAAERSYRQAINLDSENRGLVTKLTRSQRG